MYKKIIEKIKKSNTLAILGFGKEGKSTYNYIRKYLPTKKITILDSNTNLLESNIFLKNDINTSLVLGNGYLDKLINYDFIMKSPGVKIPDEIFEKIKNNIYSQIQLALEIYKNQTIAITGTKGKTTTSSLIYKMLKDQNKDCLLLGNVGNPIFDYLEQIKDTTILVIEMSSYQAETIKHSPHIGIVLNLFQDHLNYHGSVENYHLAKLNIYKYQNENDYAFYNSNNKNIDDYISKNKYSSQIIDINKEFEIIGEDIFYKGKLIYNKNTERLLIGEHNLLNILYVLRLSILLNLDLNKTINTINTFKPIEHRMEYVGTINNIKYYNDVIATIPEATINCVKGINGIDTIIFGGMNRGIDYKNLIDFFNSSDIENFICMPETGHIIAKKLNRGNIYIVETLEEAVKIAKKVTKNTCLLSPAAPSYNAFKNFEEKGKKYKELVSDQK